MDFKDIGQALALISSFIAVSGLLLKGANEVVLNIIKIKYESMAGQRSLFSTSFITLIILIYGFGFISIIFLATTGQFGKVYAGESYDLRNFDMLTICITTLLLLSLICSLSCILLKWPEVVINYHNKIENKPYEKTTKKSRLFILISLFSAGYIMAVSFFIIAMCLKSSEKEGLTAFMILFVTGVLSFIVLLNLMNIISAIDRDNKFKMITANSEVICSLFLDMGEYYLLFIDDEETYIRKTEVKNVVIIKEKVEMKKYDKLVRDKIPEIIEKDNKKCTYIEANKKDHYDLLEGKLKEEVNEFLEDKNLEELADVMEVLFSLADNLGFSEEDLMKARNEKKKKRGSFKKGIVLKEVK